jgi:hypothetical protein
MIHRIGLRRRKNHDTSEFVVANKHSDRRQVTELSSDVIGHRNGLVALEQLHGLHDRDCSCGSKPARL